jgi:hypothetical protein
MHRTIRTTLAGTVAGIAAFALAGAGTPAFAGPVAAPAAQKPVAKGLLSPLSLAVADDGTTYYTQNFAGTLHVKKPGAKAKVLYTARKQGTEVGAIGEHNGVVTFALTSPQGQTSVGLINTNHKNRVRMLGDLDAFETKKNPDGKVVYGLRGLDASCAAQFPEDGMPPSYSGIVESHPYASTPSLGDGRDGVYVVDAAANAVFAWGAGRFRTVAVLPPVPVKVTPSMAGAMEMPECAVGETYFFEPVPTDVEVGRGGDLYVSTLPGGPEDGSMAGHAAVYRIDQQAKRPKAKKVVGGLTSATGLAVSPKGDVYVAQLFGGTIVKAARGSTKAKVVEKAMLPGDVEWTRKGLYATTGVLTGLEPGTKPAGKVELFRF